VSFDPFDEVLKAMEEEGIVLNLHGEVPSSAADGVTVMNAESRFLPVLKGLVEKYPKLKIVLEHCTTADAVEAVRSLGENVVGTIVCTRTLLLSHSKQLVTYLKDRPPPLPAGGRLVRQRGMPPHSFLLVTSVLTSQHHYCKPSAKSPEDRRALLNAVVTSNGKFFLGTDSARTSLPLLLDRKSAKLTSPPSSPRHHRQKRQRQHRSRRLHPALRPGLRKPQFIHLLPPPPPLIPTLIETHRSSPP
jgi:dihydroorotase